MLTADPLTADCQERLAKNGRRRYLSVTFPHIALDT